MDYIFKLDDSYSEALYTRCNNIINLITEIQLYSVYIWSKTVVFSVPGKYIIKLFE